MVDIVEEIAEKIQDEDGALPTFYVGPKSFQNLNPDSTYDWLLYLHMPMKAPALKTKTGFIAEEFELEFFFAYKSELDWKPSQHQVLINKARFNYKRLVAYLAAHERVLEVNSRIDTLDVMNVFDANLSGVMVTIRCTPNNPVKNCTPNQAPNR